MYAAARKPTPPPNPTTPTPTPRPHPKQLPAGIIAPGETIEEVARRELKEETGYTARRVVSVSPEVHNDQGTSTSCLNLAVAEVDADAGHNLQPETEHEVRSVNSSGRLGGWVGGWVACMQQRLLQLHLHALVALCPTAPRTTPRTCRWVRRSRCSCCQSGVWPSSWRSSSSPRGGASAPVCTALHWGCSLQGLWELN